ncbi:TetR family transcriptional regulator [Streptomyces cinnamoneus]|uniref:TetR family transcriptional regulator n=1 Tax=Streptomyces cinnamoneus TaxID=53446 RepID=A0A2G1XA19_STRCJ|nr:TetR family transcriptional regulator C-terminal domain-containing protein [Streptomyces cinnamoneus]PHQ48070.1 TetR family transcriptional regulator [Streptomyces cinnamoneus]PPT15696.1 TetR family transcriptional regulator [Streptomyces cinnamoneus]
MPKIVDREARRQEVADAVFRVAARDGLENASLRKVADEAGLAIGSVRHYFTGHGELMTFAMEELARRIEHRVRGHADRILSPGARAGDRRAGMTELLAEFLPLDAARQEEATLWLAFTTAARTRPELRPRLDASHEGMHALLVRVLSEARRAGGLSEDADFDIEALRLAALLDGLTLQAVLRPGDVTPEAMRRVLTRHLDSLRHSG